MFSPVEAQGTERDLLEHLERVVVQRDRRRHDAEYRLRVMRALRAPAAAAGIASLAPDIARIVTDRVHATLF
jgi:hypothetical protein